MKYRSLRNWKYELLEMYKIEIEIDYAAYARSSYLALRHGTLFIFKGYAWDGPSGPTIDTKTFMRASLVHDALCQLIAEGKLDKKYRKRADEILREICLEDGMSKFRAWYVYNAVRMYSKLKGY